MFCTSLRRRRSFASILKTLTSTSSLGLKENDLKTHDIALPLASQLDAGTSRSSRQLRILLLSPSRVSAANLPATVQRIQHFAALTGGQDLAIVFLLYPDTTTSQEGMLAYAQLQVEMLKLVDLPPIPVLPLTKLEGLAALLKGHQAALMTHRPSKRQTGYEDGTAFELLRQCSVNAPMSKEAAFKLIDLFVDLSELAEACVHEGSACLLSSPQRTQEITVGAPGGHEKLENFRHMQGRQEYKHVVDFWNLDFSV